MITEKMINERAKQVNNEIVKLGGSDYVYSFRMTEGDTVSLSYTRGGRWKNYGYRVIASQALKTIRDIARDQLETELEG